MHWAVACEMPSSITARGIVLASFQFLGKLGRQRRAEIFRLLRICDRHDARNDWHRDPCGSRPLAKIPKSIVIEKQLSDQKVDSRVDFAFKVGQIKFGISRIRRVFRDRLRRPRTCSRHIAPE